MSHNVWIEFLGVLGLVPKYAEETTKPSAYLIIIPDLRNGIVDSRLPPRCPEQPDTRMVKRHIPGIILPSNSVLESDLEPMLEFDGNEGVRYSFFAFDNQLISIPNLGKHPLHTSYTPVDPNDETTWTPSNETSQTQLQWIPSFSLAKNCNRPGVDEFDHEKYLHTDLTPRMNQDLNVAGAMLINSGRFFVENVYRNGTSTDNKAALFEFSVPTISGSAQPEWRQALYNRMLWGFETPEPQLTITFSKAGVSATKEICIDMGSDDFSLWFANIEEHKIKLFQEQSSASDNYDWDFAAMYLFSKDVPSADQGMPLPKPSSLAILGGDPACKGSSFSS